MIILNSGLAIETGTVLDTVIMINSVISTNFMLFDNHHDNMLPSLLIFAEVEKPAQIPERLYVYAVKSPSPREILFAKKFFNFFFLLFRNQKKNFPFSSSFLLFLLFIHSSFDYCSLTLSQNSTKFIQDG